MKKKRVAEALSSLEGVGDSAEEGTAQLVQQRHS